MFTGLLDVRDASTVVSCKADFIEEIKIPSGAIHASVPKLPDKVTCSSGSVVDSHTMSFHTQYLVLQIIQCPT